MLCIDSLLTPEEISFLVKYLTEAEFVDGKLTAGWHAKLVKNNTQLSQDAPHTKTLQHTVVQALKRNRLFKAAIRPKSIRPPLFSRYTEGMTYGWHTDNAIMGSDPPIRSDVSVTVFLSSPDEYKGGELALDTPFGEQKFKLAAGCAIAYPSTMLHEVTPITQGVRLVAVTWVQSFVRSAEEREILFEIETVRQTLFQKYGKSPEFDLLCKTHANLLRKWVDT